MALIGAPVRSGHVDRPGCRIFFEVTGRGPAIVFAHGLGSNHLTWWQQVAHFADRYTCVAFSHRGYPPGSAVGVTFTILPDGNVTAVRVTQPSGASLLDMAAQRAILNAAPFGPLPREYGQNPRTIQALFKPTY